MADLPDAPDPKLRPAWARWLWERQVDYRAAGRAIGRSHEWVRMVCLPFDDPKRLEPNAQDAERIAAWTRGDITPQSFQAPMDQQGAQQ